MIGAPGQVIQNPKRVSAREAFSLVLRRLGKSVRTAIYHIAVVLNISQEFLKENFKFRNEVF